MGLFSLGKSDEPSPPQQPPIGKGPEFSQEIENALREGGRQIRFDDIEKRYRGKRVWVLDRLKIQENVMKVVDAAVAKSLQHAEGGVATRARVAQALARLFGDNRSLTSEVDPAQLASRRAPTPQAAPAAGGATNEDLQRQIERLEDVIGRAEQMISKMSTAMARGGWLPRSAHGLRPRPGPFEAAHRQALEEIFKSNLELRKAIVAQPAAVASAAANPGTSKSSAPSAGS